VRGLAGLRAIMVHVVCCALVLYEAHWLCSTLTNRLVWRPKLEIAKLIESSLIKYPIPNPYRHNDAHTTFDVWNAATLPRSIKIPADSPARATCGSACMLHAVTCSTITLHAVLTCADCARLSYVSDQRAGRCEISRKPFVE
jgi:hypothetical protein